MVDALNVLFLCTGNSARSVLAEATLNHLAGGRFRAFSAGSHPAGRVNPAALAQLRTSGIDSRGLRSKSWDEFSAADAPRLDLVITVCGNADGEVCPSFAGDFVRSHWGQPDPALVQAPPAAVVQAFAQAHATILARLHALIELPLADWPQTQWQVALDRIANDGS